MKIQYNTDKSGLENKINDTDKKIPDIREFANKTDYDNAISEIEGRMPNTTGLATTAALNFIEDKTTKVRGKRSI